MSKKARLFMNGRSQAIRLPMECRFEGDSVLITKIGDALIIRAESNDKWQPLKQVIGSFDNESLIERNQPQMPEKREEF